METSLVHILTCVNTKSPDRRRGNFLNSCSSLVFIQLIFLVFYRHHSNAYLLYQDYSKLTKNASYFLGKHSVMGADLILLLVCMNL